MDLEACPDARPPNGHCIQSQPSTRPTPILTLPPPNDPKVAIVDSIEADDPPEDEDIAGSQIELSTELSLLPESDDDIYSESSVSRPSTPRKSYTHRTECLRSPRSRRSSLKFADPNVSSQRGGLNCVAYHTLPVILNAQNAQAATLTQAGNLPSFESIFHTPSVFAAGNPDVHIPESADLELPSQMPVGSREITVPSRAQLSSADQPMNVSPRGTNQNERNSPRGYDRGVREILSLGSYNKAGLTELDNFDRRTRKHRASRDSAMISIGKAQSPAGSAPTRLLRSDRKRLLPGCADPERVSKMNFSASKLESDESVKTSPYQPAKRKNAVKKKRGSPTDSLHTADSKEKAPSRRRLRKAPLNEETKYDHDGAAQSNFISTQPINPSLAPFTESPQSHPDNPAVKQNDFPSGARPFAHNDGGEVNTSIGSGTKVLAHTSGSFGSAPQIMTPNLATHRADEHPFQAGPTRKSKNGSVKKKRRTEVIAYTAPSDSDTPLSQVLSRHLSKHHSNRPKAREAFSIDKAAWVRPKVLRAVKRADLGGLMMPPVYASNRQELCEGLSYFRSYQGGHYVKSGRTYGYLLDGFPAPRDVFADGGRVIISHGGGGSIRPRSGLELKFAKSQLRYGTRVSALRNCLEYQVPVVLLAGSKYSQMPWLVKLPNVNYAVLGYYLVTHYWAEAELSGVETLVRFKFRFQWLSSQGDPWWLSHHEREQPDVPNQPTTSLRTVPLITSQVCAECSFDSPNVYSGDWRCLHETCIAFFKSALAPEHQSYEYDSAMLLHQVALQIEQQVPTQLEPEDFRLRALRYPMRKLNEDSFKGIWCQACGRLSCRIFWGRLECKECREGVDLARYVYKAAELPQNFGRHIQDKIIPFSGIAQPEPAERDGWTILEYKLPDSAGSVFHATRRESDTEQADELFKAYQYEITERGFMRNPLVCSKVDGLVGQQFLLNCGEAYKFCTKVHSYPWEESPKPARCARNLLNGWLNGSLASTRGPYPVLDFNEVLSCAYLPNGGMKWHADDERGLGPIVASLSLGASGVMRFRPKPQKKIARKRGHNGREDNDERSPAALQLFLKHGDVVVQCGALIQEKWLHAVATEGHRIAATARFISSDHHTNRPLLSERPKRQFEPVQSSITTIAEAKFAPSCVENQYISSMNAPSLGVPEGLFPHHQASCSEMLNSPVSQST